MTRRKYKAFSLKEQGNKTTLLLIIKIYNCQTELNNINLYYGAQKAPSQFSTEQKNEI